MRRSSSTAPPSRPASYEWIAMDIAAERNVARFLRHHRHRRRGGSRDRLERAERPIATRQRLYRPREPGREAAVRLGHAQGPGLSARPAPVLPEAGVPNARCHGVRRAAGHDLAHVGRGLTANHCNDDDPCGHGSTTSVTSCTCSPATARRSTISTARDDPIATVDATLDPATGRLRLPDACSIPATTRWPSPARAPTTTPALADDMLTFGWHRASTSRTPATSRPWISRRSHSSSSGWRRAWRRRCPSSPA